MKQVIVLHAGHPSISFQAIEIQTFCSGLETEFFKPDIWCFYHQQKPKQLPVIASDIDRMILIPIENPFIPESYLFLLKQLAAWQEPDLFIFSGSWLGKQLAARLAFRLNGNSCLNVKYLDLQSQPTAISRPAGGNYLFARNYLKSTPICISVGKQPSTKNDLPYMDISSAEIFEHKTQPVLDWITDIKYIGHQKKDSLEEADFVLAIGQGIKSKEKLDQLLPVVDELGATLGTSRPVVMNGWAGMETLIGASGAVISPKICITAGISGSGYFIIGIKNSELIVAINIDPEAPIFKQADVGIVGDLNQVLEALRSVISDRCKKSRSQENDHE